MAGKFTGRGSKRTVRFCRARVLSSPSEEKQRQADKSNRKFSARLRRFERWHNITGELSKISILAAPFGPLGDFGASPDDVKAMKEIHRLIQECRTVAEDRLKEAKIYDRILR